YAFNRAHSAAYGHLAMAAVFLKAHWPAQLCAAQLTTRMGYYPPQTYVNEAVRLGISVLPPCVNKSAVAPRVGGENAIRLGLDYVKGLGAEGSRLVAVRGGQQFGSLRDLLSRWQPSEAALRGLVQAGALDCLEPNRRKLLAALPLLATAFPEEDLLGQVQETRELWLPDLPDLSPDQKAAAAFASLGLILNRDWLEQRQPPWDLTRVQAADISKLPPGRPVAVVAAVANRRYGKITLDDFSTQVQVKYDGPVPAFWVWARGRVAQGSLEEVELRPLEGVLAR
ncbi:MAG TPA: hypothetical protein DG577_03055, partial [Firmicutes bacterium]|nr:hypothetical protein [Bacillota bacterium]